MIAAARGDIAASNLAYGLVDKTGGRLEFGKRVAEIVGAPAGKPQGNFKSIKLANWIAANPLPATGDAIGVVMALTSGRRRLHWMVGAVCIAAAVGLSRTYLSAHWLSDVVGGSLIGAGLALAVPEAFEVVRDRRRGVSAGESPPAA